MRAANDTSLLGWRSGSYDFGERVLSCNVDEYMGFEGKFIICRPEPDRVGTFIFQDDVIPHAIVVLRSLTFYKHASGYWGDWLADYARESMDEIAREFIEWLRENGVKARKWIQVKWLDEKGRTYLDILSEIAEKLSTGTNEVIVEFYSELFGHSIYVTIPKNETYRVQELLEAHKYAVENIYWRPFF